MLADLSYKMVFVDSFRNATMTENLAREIKNEIYAFRHNADVATFRLTFNEFCSEAFYQYGTYDFNPQAENKDKLCLYLAYSYVMIAVTQKSVMSNMITKLASSGSDYLSDLTNGFHEVQEVQSETDITWLRSVFEGEGAGGFICGAFRYDTDSWAVPEEKQYALIYIKTIDSYTKTLIDEYDCSKDFSVGKQRNEINVVKDKIKLCTYNIYPFSEKNVLKISSPLSITKGKTIVNVLDGWGQSFTVDFFLHYTGNNLYCNNNVPLLFLTNSI